MNVDPVRDAFDTLVEAGCNVQVAPAPTDLIELVGTLKYREHWQFWVISNEDRDQGEKRSMGMTLIVQIYEPDTYHPERKMRVNHLFIVPAATYNRDAWQRWLFDRILDVERHEAMEFFQIAGVRPFAPNHGPGFDPYTVTQVGTLEDKRTNYLGEKRDQDAPLRGRP